MPRFVVFAAGVASVGLWLASVSAGAEGGATIASAPTLVWGQVERGVGGNNVAGTQPWGSGGRTFWRLRVFRGDRIAGSGHVKTGNGCATNRIVLFAPKVNDASLSAAKPLVSSGTIFQNSCAALRFTWVWGRVPVTGLATLWAAISPEAPTFTLVARVQHATTISFGAMSVKPGTTTVIAEARVSSVAGVPSGECLFDARVDGGAWAPLMKSTTSGGACTVRAPTGAKRSVQVRVRFVAAKDWLPSAATAAAVTVL